MNQLPAPRITHDQDQTSCSVTTERAGDTRTRLTARALVHVPQPLADHMSLHAAVTIDKDIRTPEGNTVDAMSIKLSWGALRAFGQDILTLCDQNEAKQ